MSSALRPLKRHDTNNPLFADGILVKKILVESLVDGDIETFKDVLIAHLRAKPSTRRSIEARLRREILNDLTQEVVDFDPTFSTLRAILQSIAFE